MTDTYSKKSTRAFAGVLLALVSIFPTMAAVVISPVLPQMLKTFATSPLPVPVIISAPSLTVAIFAPIAGLIVDRVGRRNLLFTAMVLYGVLGSAPAWLPQASMDGSIFPLLALRLLVGIAEGAVVTAATTLIGDYFSGAQRNRYLSLQMIFSTLSGSVFVVIAGVIGTAGWHAPFWLYAVAIVILAPMLLIVREPARQHRDAAGAAGSIGRFVWFKLVIALLGGVLFFTIVTQGSLAYVGVGITDARSIGFISGGVALATCAGSLLFPAVARIGSRVLLTVAFGLLGVGLVTIWLASGNHSQVGVIAGAVVGNVGTGLLLPTMLVWTVTGLGFAERGRVTGRWQSAVFLGQFLSPLTVQAFERGGPDAAVTALPGVLGGMGIVSVLIAVVLAVVVRAATAPIEEETVLEAASLETY